MVLQSFVRWFNPVAATRIECRKLTGFTLLIIDIEFTKPVFPTIYKLFLPVVYIEPTGNNELVHISIQMH